MILVSRDCWCSCPGADGLEDNGYYEAEDLVWLVAHEGVVYNADVTYNMKIHLTQLVNIPKVVDFVYSINRTTPFMKDVWTQPTSISILWLLPNQKACSDLYLWMQTHLMLTMLV